MSETAAIHTEQADSRQRAPQPPIPAEAGQAPASAADLVELLQMAAGEGAGGTQGGIKPTIARQMLRMQAARGNRYVQRIATQGLGSEPARKFPSTLETTAHPVPPQVRSNDPYPGLLPATEHQSEAETEPGAPLVARTPVSPIQRQAPVADTTRQAEAGELTTHIGTLESVAEGADAMFDDVIAQSNAGVTALDEMSVHLSIAEFIYGLAYAEHKRKVGQINAKALEEGIGDTIIGIAIGVGVAFALPEVAAGAVALKIFVQAGGELAELGIGEVKEDLEGPPTQAETAGPTPAEVRASHMETLMHAHRAMNTTIPARLQMLHEISSGARDLIIDIQRYEEGDNKWSFDKINTFVDGLKSTETAFNHVPPRINQAVEAIFAQREKMREALPSLRYEALLAMVWTRWLASLDDEDLTDFIAFDAYGMRTYLQGIGVLGGFQPQFPGDYVDDLAKQDQAVLERAAAQAQGEAENLMSSTGVAATALDPNGYVTFGDRTLTARAAGRPIQQGESVIVCGGGAVAGWEGPYAWPRNAIQQIIVTPAGG